MAAPLRYALLLSCSAAVAAVSSPAPAERWLQVQESSPVAPNPDVGLNLATAEDGVWPLINILEGIRRAFERILRGPHYYEDPTAQRVPAKDQPTNEEISDAREAIRKEREAKKTLKIAPDGGSQPTGGSQPSPPAAGTPAGAPKAPPAEDSQQKKPKDKDTKNSVKEADGETVDEGVKETTKEEILPAVETARESAKGAEEKRDEAEEAQREAIAAMKKGKKTESANEAKKADEAAAGARAQADKAQEAFERAEAALKVAEGSPQGAEAKMAGQAWNWNAKQSNLQAEMADPPESSAVVTAKKELKLAEQYADFAEQDAKAAKEFAGIAKDASERAKRGERGGDVEPPQVLLMDAEKSAQDSKKAWDDDDDAVAKESQASTALKLMEEAMEDLQEAVVQRELKKSFWRRTPAWAAMAEAARDQAVEAVKLIRKTGRAWQLSEAQETILPAQILVEAVRRATAQVVNELEPVQKFEVNEDQDQPIMRAKKAMKQALRAKFMAKKARRDIARARKNGKSTGAADAALKEARTLARRAAKDAQRAVDQAAKKDKEEEQKQRERQAEMEPKESKEKELKAKAARVKVDGARNEDLKEAAQDLSEEVLDTEREKADEADKADKAMEDSVELKVARTVKGIVDTDLADSNKDVEVPLIETEVDAVKGKSFLELLRESKELAKEALLVLRPPKTENVDAEDPEEEEEPGEANNVDAKDRDNMPVNDPKEDTEEPAKDEREEPAKGDKDDPKGDEKEPAKGDKSADVKDPSVVKGELDPSTDDMMKLADNLNEAVAKADQASALEEEASSGEDGVVEMTELVVGKGHDAEMEVTEALRAETIIDVLEDNEAGVPPDDTTELQKLKERAASAVNKAVMALTATEQVKLAKDMAEEVVQAKNKVMAARDAALEEAAKKDKAESEVDNAKEAADKAKQDADKANDEEAKNQADEKMKEQEKAEEDAVEVTVKVRKAAKAEAEKATDSLLTAEKKAKETAQFGQDLKDKKELTLPRIQQLIVLFRSL